MRRHAPFLVPFEDRARIFTAVIAADRAEHRERGAYGPQSFVTVHRATLMQVRRANHSHAILRTMHGATLMQARATIRSAFLGG